MVLVGLTILSGSVILFTQPVRRLSYQMQGLILGIQTLEVAMAAIARILSRVSGTDIEVEVLKTLAIFCGVGLFAALLLATYGLDLSAGFF